MHSIYDLLHLFENNSWSGHFWSQNDVPGYRYPGTRVPGYRRPGSRVPWTMVHMYPDTPVLHFLLLDICWSPALSISGVWFLKWTGFSRPQTWISIIYTGTGYLVTDDLNTRVPGYMYPVNKQRYGTKIHQSKFICKRFTWVVIVLINNSKLVRNPSLSTTTSRIWPERSYGHIDLFELGVQM